MLIYVGAFDTVSLPYSIHKSENAFREFGLI